MERAASFTAAYDDRAVVRRRLDERHLDRAPGPVHVVDPASRPEGPRVVRTALPRRGETREAEAVQVGVAHGVHHVTERLLPSYDPLERRDLTSVTPHEHGPLGSVAVVGLDPGD